MLRYPFRDALLRHRYFVSCLVFFFKHISFSVKLAIDYSGVGVGVWIFYEKGKWEIPGGALDFGETLEDAIKREMQEELGIEIEIIEQWPAKNHIIPEDKQHWVPTTFFVRLKKGQTPKIMESHKHDALGWFAPDNFPTPLSLISALDLEEYKKRFS